MSRKVIQLLYVVPNDEDFNAAFWNVVFYFEEKGCMSKCGCNVWELSNDLMIFAVSIDTAFLTPKRFNVELDSRQSHLSEMDGYDGWYSDCPMTNCTGVGTELKE